MKSRFLKLKGNRLTLVVNAPEKINSTIKIDISLPHGAKLEKLIIEGTVEKCVRVPIDEENKYLLEVKLSKLTETGRLILQAYLNYLEHEKQLDQIHKILNFESILVDVLEGEAAGLDERAIQEYIAVRLKGIPFN